MRDEMSDQADMAADVSASWEHQYKSLHREMLAVEQFALMRSKDVSLEPHERAQWRRLLTIARRAVGEPT